MVNFQDTPLSSTDTPSHTATTTVIITIVDVNNRPPWFQPCTETTIRMAKVCLNSGYTGRVSNETVINLLFSFAHIYLMLCMIEYITLSWIHLGQIGIFYIIAWCSVPGAWTSVFYWWRQRNKCSNCLQDCWRLDTIEMYYMATLENVISYFNSWKSHHSSS